MHRMYFLAISALGLASCAEGPTVFGPSPTGVYEPTPPAVSFDSRDFAWSTAAGTGSISGALSYRQGGAHYTCQGGDVLLTPETAWSRRRMVILYGSAIGAAAPVSIVRARTPSAGTGDYARFVRRTTCDAANHFSFAGLPDGAWFVITVGKPLDRPGEPMAVTRRVETHGGGVTVNLS
ncbi:MAG TPA: hypothetical protein VKQ54_07775 [Caulobacteraceae bacterium]|nr:hypothetical protein [Caulobacteraceae bacterium]